MTGAFKIPHLADAPWQDRIEAEFARQYALLQKNQLEIIDERIQQIAFEGENLAIQEGSIAFKATITKRSTYLLWTRSASELIPWRKGPFRLGDLAIDAEWRSDKKWDRIAPDLPDLKGQARRRRRLQ